MKKYLNYFLVFAMLIISIILFITKGIILLSFNFLFAFIFYFVFVYILKYFKVNPKYNILITISIWLHLIGLAYAYNNFFYYDKFVHFTEAFFITLMAYDFSIKNLKSDKSLVIFLAVLGILTLWEIYEYAEDAIFHFGAQGVFNSLSKNPALSPIDDTMWDLIIGSFGSIVALLILKLKDISAKK